MSTPVSGHSSAAPARPLAGLRLCLAGPGRVGTSLASWAAARGAEVVAVAGRAPQRTAPVAAGLGARAATLDELSSADCDLLLVAVADGAIAEVAERLAGRPQAAVALHTAGSLGASVLAPLEAAGSAVGSFHPLKAFPRPLPDPAEAAGVFFATDGAPRAQALAGRLAEAFGARVEEVPEGVRDLYHLAASVAAGGVVTLVASAAALAASLGLPNAVGSGYLSLAQGALAEAGRLARQPPEPPGLERALTGPLARGEAATFLRELGALAAAGTEGGRRLDLFARLALETARLSPGGEAAAGKLSEALAGAGFLDPPGGEC